MKQCGSIHPNYPNLVCERWCDEEEGEHCLLDDHIGVLEHKNGFREPVMWGKYLEKMVTENRMLPFYRLIWIKDEV